jgi:hypothetical protein
MKIKLIESNYKNFDCDNPSTVEASGKALSGKVDPSDVIQSIIRIAEKLNDKIATSLRDLNCTAEYLDTKEVGLLFKFIGITLHNDGVYEAHEPHEEWVNWLDDPTDSKLKSLSGILGVFIRGANKKFNEIASKKSKLDGSTESVLKHIAPVLLDWLTYIAGFSGKDDQHGSEALLASLRALASISEDEQKKSLEGVAGGAEKFLKGGMSIIEKKNLALDLKHILNGLLMDRLKD